MIQFSLKSVTKAFGGVRAVDDVSLSVDAGSIHGLIGPNGAGKTTVINLATGLIAPDEGEISFDGKRIDRFPSHRIAGLGMRRTFQNIRLFPRMSVLEHVIVASHTVRPDRTLQRILFSPGSRAEERQTIDQAMLVLERIGIAHRARELAVELPYGDQRRLEIASALASNPKLILLDEPTAGMNPVESDRMEALMQSLSDEGRTIVLIEHNMGLVMSVCDQITVMDFGRVIASGRPDSVRNDPGVIEAYLGKEDTV